MEASDRSWAVLAGVEWKMLMNAFDAAARALPAGTWMEVRYEDLLDDPRKEVQRVLEFLELE